MLTSQSPAGLVDQSDETTMTGKAASSMKRSPFDDCRRPESQTAAEPRAAAGMAIPSRTMTVDPETSKHRFDYGVTTYHFCSAGCRGKFAADPEKYLKRKATLPADVPAGTIYTCPMHPEIRQVGPGTCPICGMALEPEVATADAGPNP